jgi:hypothetical protein
MLWLLPTPIFGQINGTSLRNFTIDFESILVNTSHDPQTTSPQQTTSSWALDAVINGKRVNLNPAGQLSFIKVGKEIPLGIQHEVSIPENDTIRVLTAGFDEDGNDLNQTFSDPIRNVIEHADIGPVRVNVPNLLAVVSKPMDTNDDPVGTVIKQFGKDDNFGIGSHMDCSEMTTPIINLEDFRTNACDYILRYTIRDENIPLIQNDWKPNWETVPGSKSITSNVSVISTGPNKFELVTLGADNVLWHIDYNHGFGAWEPLSTYVNVLNAFLPSNSTVGLSSWSPSRLDIFVKDQNNTTQYKWLDITERGWRYDWIELPGQIGSEPSVFSLAPGRISMFAVDKNAPSILCGMNITSVEDGFSTLGWISKAPGFNKAKDENAACSYVTPAVSEFLEDCQLECRVITSWQNFTSSPPYHTIKSPPVLLNTNSGRIDSFTLIDDGKLLHQYFEQNASDEWIPSKPEVVFEDYIFSSRPSVVSKSDVNLDLEIYGRTSDGHLRIFNYPNMNETDPEIDLGYIDTAPAVVSWDEPENTFVFAKNGTSLVYNWKGYGMTH